MENRPFDIENFPGKVPADEADARQLFDAEWNKAVSLFAVATGLDDPRIELPRLENGEYGPPNVALDEAFQGWRKVQSSWDRRKGLLHIAFQLTQAGMPTWRKANLYCLDRRPDVALSHLKGVARPSRFDRSYAEHCGAYAMAYLGLTQYADALDWAKKAAEASPSNSRMQVLLADALMLTGACDEANAIYSARMSAASAMREDVDPIPEMFANLFARDTGSIGSPVLAITIAETLADPEESDKFWTLLEAEFYDSPHFRMHHAYFMAKQGQEERSIAKLLALAMEMPWVREATLNANAMLDAHGPSDDKVGVKVTLEKRIKENGWSTDGMHKIEIKFGPTP